MYESGENYLETILILKEKQGVVRSIDVARTLNFSKPNGKEKAEAIYERHKLLTKFLQRVSSVNAKVAEEDACKMEHIISDETFQGIKEFMKDL